MTKLMSKIISIFCLFSYCFLLLFQASEICSLLYLISSYANVVHLPIFISSSFSLIMSMLHYIHYTLIITSFTDLCNSQFPLDIFVFSLTFLDASSGHEYRLAIYNCKTCLTSSPPLTPLTCSVQLLKV